MTLPLSDARTPLDLDELAALAADAAQFVPDDTPLEQDEDDSALAAVPPGLPVEDGQTAADEPAHRAPLQTREAYLKKGEDLIRSLL